MKMHRTALIALGGFILLAPGFVQVLGWDIPELRSWRMYSGVGLGAPYGVFEVIGPAGAEGRVDLVDAMGLDSIRQIQRYTGSGSLKAGFDADTSIDEAGAEICQTLQYGQRLIFRGKIAARDGWATIRKDHDELCPGK